VPAQEEDLDEERLPANLGLHSPGQARQFGKAIRDSRQCSLLISHAKASFWNVNRPGLACLGSPKAVLSAQNALALPAHLEALIRAYRREVAVQQANENG
jgi:hypothetical protein